MIRFWPLIRIGLAPDHYTIDSAYKLSLFICLITKKIMNTYHLCYIGHNCIWINLRYGILVHPNLNTIQFDVFVYNACQYHSVTLYFFDWLISTFVIKTLAIIFGLCPNRPNMDSRFLLNHHKQGNPRLRHKEAFFNQQVGVRLIKFAI